MRAIFFKTIIITLTIGLLVLSGCSATYQTVAKYTDSGEILVGQLIHNLEQGSASFSIKSETSSFACNGIGERPYYIPSGLSCAGQRGRGFASCTDGRTVNFEWVAEACTRVRGSGKDSLGNQFIFIADYDQSIESMKSELQPTK